MSESLGALIRAAREQEPKWTQVELAKHAGVNAETIGRAEDGGNLRLSTLYKISAALEEKTGRSIVTALNQAEGDAKNAAGDARNKTVRNPIAHELESPTHAMADQEVPDKKDGAMGGDNRTELLDQLTATAKRLPLKALQTVVDVAMEKDMARRRPRPTPAKNRRA